MRGDDARRFPHERTRWRRARIVQHACIVAVLGFGAMTAHAQISPGALARPHAAFDGASGCVKCHGLKGEPMDRLCLECHREIGWLMQEKRGLHARTAGREKRECTSCHPDHAGADFRMVEWTEGSSARFDHRRAGWGLEGKHRSAKCESCHAPTYRTGPAATLSRRARASGAGWIGLEKACISCHEADDVHDGALAATCESCHDARTWEEAPRFDHDEADYRLDGKHVDVACDKCHLTSKLRTRTNANGERVSLFKPVPHRECSSCHADPHKGRLSAQCSECHVTRGFDVVDRREFNHALTRYPLKGKHVAVGCAACHGPDLSRMVVPFAACASCHADAHAGAATIAGRPVDCAACHRVDGFAPATFTVAQHAETRYRLDGKHLGVKCATCHASTRTTGTGGTGGTGGTAATRASVATRAAAVRFRPASARCADCHDDSHGGQLAARTPAVTCEACHVTAGFAPSTFSRQAHVRLRLPLDGRHASIACVACHGKQRPGLPAWPTGTNAGAGGVVLAIADATCASCHVDPHGGRFASDGCASCHDAAAFRPSTVGAASHAALGFPLEGAHGASPCIACHAELSQAKGSSTLLVGARGVARLPFGAKRGDACTACHATPHGSQFVARKDQGRCDACHGVRAFVPASRFDHERDAAFSLEGAHARVPCQRCHSTERLPSGEVRVTYRPVATTCEACHAATPKRGRS